MKKLMFIAIISVLGFLSCQDYAKEDVYAYYTSTMQFTNNTNATIVIELKNVTTSHGFYYLSPGEKTDTINWYFKTSGKYYDKMNILVTGGCYGGFLFNMIDKENYTFDISQSNYIVDCVRTVI